jgi:hypothetical protein
LRASRSSQYRPHSRRGALASRDSLPSLNLSEGDAIIDNMQEVSVRLRTTRALRLYLEPWGDEFDCPAEATIQIAARGPKGDTLEVEVSEDGVTVYGWPGSVVSILRDGVPLREQSAPR